MKKSTFATFFLMLASSFASLHADQLRTASQADPLHPHHHTHFGSYYTKSNNLVLPEHAICFDRESVKADGIDHVPGTGDFYLPEPGIYRVSYSVSLCARHGMVALKLDDNVVPGSEICIAEADELTSHTMLIQVCGKACCEHKLRLINNYPECESWWNNSIKLQSCDADCCTPDRNITASITIERVGDIASSCSCKK